MTVFAADILPFTLSICLVLILGGLELAGLLLGIAPGTRAIMSVTPAPDGPPLMRGLHGFLRWLSLDRIPALIAVLILLSAFGLIGIAEQGVWRRLSGDTLHPFIASVPALAGALIVTHYAGRSLSPFLRGDGRSSAVKADFVGRIATIVLGSATVGRPAEARLVDFDGTVHHVLVEPHLLDQTLPEGSEVIVVRQEGTILRVVIHPHR